MFNELYERDKEQPKQTNKEEEELKGFFCYNRNEFSKKNFEFFEKFKKEKEEAKNVLELIELKLLKNDIVEAMR